MNSTIDSSSTTASGAFGVWRWGWEDSAGEMCVRIRNFSCLEYENVKLANTPMVSTCVPFLFCLCRLALRPDTHANSMPWHHTSVSKRHPSLCNIDNEPATFSKTRTADRTTARDYQPCRIFPSEEAATAADKSPPQAMALPVQPPPTSLLRGIGDVSAGSKGRSSRPLAAARGLTIVASLGSLEVL